MTIETYTEKYSSLYWSVCRYFIVFLRNKLVTKAFLHQNCFSVLPHLCQGKS